MATSLPARSPFLCSAPQICSGRRRRRAWGTCRMRTRKALVVALLALVRVRVAVVGPRPGWGGALAIDERQGIQWRWAVDYETTAAAQGLIAVRALSGVESAWATAAARAAALRDRFSWIVLFCLLLVASSLTLRAENLAPQVDVSGTSAGSPCHARRGSAGPRGSPGAYPLSFLPRP